MKTTMIARCVFAGTAIFAAAGLIGCGAEGSGEPGAVGETSQALNGTAHAIDATAYSAITVNLTNAATCVLHGTYNGTAGDYPLVIGGFDLAGTGNEVRDAYLFDRFTGVGGTWTKFSFGAAGDEVAYVSAMTDPANLATCVLVGGEKAGTSTTKTFVFTLGANAAASGFAAGPALHTARSKAAITKCQNKIMVVAGTNSGTRLADVEVLSGGTWHQTTGLLSTPRHSLAVVPNDTKTSDNATEFLIAGGNVNGGRTNKLEAIHVPTSSACGVSGTITATQYTTTLSAAVEAPVAFPKSYASLNTPADALVFVVAGGKGSATNTDVVTITAPWNNVANAAVAAAGTAIPNATSFAALVRVPDVGTTTNPDAYMIVGGDNGSGTAVASVQEYQDGFGTGGWYTTQTLPNTRISPNAIRLPDLAKVIVSAGGSTVTKTITP